MLSYLTCMVKQLEKQPHLFIYMIMTKLVGEALSRSTFLPTLRKPPCLLFSHSLRGPAQSNPLKSEVFEGLVDEAEVLVVRFGFCMLIFWKKLRLFFFWEMGEREEEIEKEGGRESKRHSGRKLEEREKKHNVTYRYVITNVDGRSAKIKGQKGKRAPSA